MEQGRVSQKEQEVHSGLAELRSQRLKFRKIEMSVLRAEHLRGDSCDEKKPQVYLQRGSPES